MITGLAPPVLVLAAALAQSPQGPDELRALARDGPDSVLIERTRQRPDDAREALRRLLASAEAASLAAAARLAGAYAVAWRDSFFVRQVARFVSLSPADRQAKVAADSVRLAGNAALGSAGVEAAMRAWRESLRRFEALADTAGVAAALGNLGVGFYIAQEYDSSTSYLARSRDLAERIGDYRTAGNAVGTFASVSKDRGDLRQASDLYARASEIRERSGDARGLAADQNNLGLIAQELGDVAGARRAFGAALAANRSAGRAEPAATNLVNLGNLASIEGDYAEASARYREALAIYRERGNRLDAASVLHNLGLLAMRRGDYPAAVTTLQQATATNRQTGPAAEEIVARQDLANARAAAGDLQGARLELQRAERRAGRDGGGSSLAGLALARADLAVAFNLLGEGERHYARAERLARGVGDGATRAAAQQGEGLVLLMRESYRRAQATLELALRAQEGSGDRRAPALTRLLIGYAAGQRGDTAAARRVLLQALDTLQTLGDAAGEAAALGALGDLETRAGLPLTAESLLPARAGPPGSAAGTRDRVAAARRPGAGPAQPWRARGGGSGAAGGNRGDRAGVRRVVGRGAPGGVPRGQVGRVRRSRAGPAGARAAGGRLRGERRAQGEADARSACTRARRRRG